MSPKPKAYADDIPVWCSHDEIGSLEKAIENPRNPNKHPEAQIKLLANIIKVQGWRNPITISNLSGFITKGAGRRQAAELLGVAHVPLDYQDYENEAAEYADLIADNRIAELAEPDLDLVKDILESIEGLDAELTGYNLDDLLGEDKEVPEDPGAQIDRAEELQHEWKTEYGQVWEIPSKSSPGRAHRLMCGDSTSKDDINRLMSDALADMVFTDPPYGVSYAGKNEFLNAISRGNHIQKPIENDSKTVNEMGELWDSAFTRLFEVSKPGACYYITGPQGGELMMMMMMSISKAGWILKHMLIWVKNNHVLGRSDYNYKHEPILYGWKKGGHHFYGDHSQTSVWEINKPQKSDLHPTMKPVELVKRAVENSTRPGDLVLDGFCGSGTTIIACEQSGRIGYGMEMDAGYTAVILQRCLDMGLEPILVK